MAVVGGGNSAVEEALYLSALCERVTLIHRRDSLRAEGDGRKVTGLLVYNKKKQEAEQLNCSALFVAVGHIPQTDLVKDLIELKDGYVKSRLTTKISGLFVAGDVSDSIYRQAITAAGDGCRAALEAVKFLESRAESAIKIAPKARTEEVGRRHDSSREEFGARREFKPRGSFGSDRGPNRSGGNRFGGGGRGSFDSGSRGGFGSSRGGFGGSRGGFGGGFKDREVSGSGLRDREGGRKSFGTGSGGDRDSSTKRSFGRSFGGGNFGNSGMGRGRNRGRDSEKFSGNENRKSW